jgi:co-chaperonin GroES (HSP10)
MSDALPTTRIRPMYNQIVVLRDEPPVKIGVIHVPDTVRDRLAKETTSGFVLRVGPGRFARRKIPHKFDTSHAPVVAVGFCVRCHESGVRRDELCSKLIDTHDRLPLDVRRGDRVWFHHQAGESISRQTDIEEHGRRLTIMWDDEVLAIDWDVRGVLELGEILGSPGTGQALASALS